MDVEMWMYEFMDCQWKAKKTTKDLRHVVLISMTSNANNDDSCLKAVNHLLAKNIKIIFEDGVRRHVVFTESHQRNTKNLQLDDRG